MGLFDRLLRREGSSATIPALDRATGAALEVQSVHAWGRGTERLQRIALPAEGLPHIGPFVHLSLDGPGWLRPGDRSEPSPVPLYRVGELTLVRSGELEYRDSLGNSGVLGAGQARFVAGGSGVTNDVGVSPRSRRDGAHLDALTVRWLEAGPAGEPDVRVATHVPAATQGRSVLHRVLAPGGAIQTPTGPQMFAVRVAAGATVDLGVPMGHSAGVVVVSGEVLLGDDLAVVRGPATVAMAGQDGGRLTLVTRLESEDDVTVVVLTGPVPGSPRVHRFALLAADTDDELSDVVERTRTTGFGPLPSWPS